MNKRGNVVLSVLLGVALASVFGFTLDQIWNRAFVSASNAIRVTAAGGGGFPASSITSGTTTITGGTDNAICRKDGLVFACDGVGLLNDAGQFLGAVQGSGLAPIYSVIGDTDTGFGALAADAPAVYRAGLIAGFWTGSATQGQFALYDPLQASTLALTVNSSAAANTTALNIPSTGVLSVAGAGIVIGASGASGAIRFSTGGTGQTRIYGTLDATGTWTLNNQANAVSPLVVQDNGTPVFTIADGGFVTMTSGLSYGGALNVTGIVAVSSSANVGASTRIESCTSGASAITRTLPAATGSGRVVDLVKIDSGAGTCIFGRTGSDTLNGATTRTLSAQYKADTCIDIASALWLCRGDGT